MKTLTVSKLTLDEKRTPLYNLLAVPDFLCRLLLPFDNYTLVQDGPDVGDLEGEPTVEKLRRARVTIGTDEQGETIVKWASGATQEELNYSIARIMVESGRMNDLIQTVMSTPNVEFLAKTVSFQTYAESWMETYKVGKWKPTTHAGYKSNLKCHIYPVLGQIPIGQITTDDIQRFLNGCNHLAKNTIHTMLVLISEVLHSAVEDKLISTNPAASKRLTNPSSAKEIRNALTQESLVDIVQHIPLLGNSEDICLMVLLALTGMRRGEVLGLRWEDVDFDAGLIHVRRSVTYVSNRPNITTPKSKNGYRQIPIMNQLRLLISVYRAKGYVIGGENPISMQSFRNSMIRINKQIDLHGATPQIFRHTFLTMLDRTGTGAKTIQAIAGHGDIKITMNRYVHSQEDQIILAGEKIDTLFTLPAPNE